MSEPTRWGDLLARYYSVAVGEVLFGVVAVRTWVDDLATEYPVTADEVESWANIGCARAMCEALCQVRAAGASAKQVLAVAIVIRDTPR